MRSGGVVAPVVAAATTALRGHARELGHIQAAVPGQHPRARGRARSCSVLLRGAGGRHAAGSIRGRAGETERRQSKGFLHGGCRSRRACTAALIGETLGSGEVRGSDEMGFGHAVVIGGSISGMVAARVLLDTFARVTVLDRDRELPGLDAGGHASAAKAASEVPQHQQQQREQQYLHQQQQQQQQQQQGAPDLPRPRRGVPQSTQPHVLFTRGYRILEEYFPGIGVELEAAGALQVDWPQEFKLFADDRWAVNTKGPTGLYSYTCSRYLLEFCVRRRLAQLPGLHMRTQQRVRGLCTSSSGRVTGVRLEGSEVLSADLVVNASGRGSNIDKWLAAEGLEPPQTEVVDGKLGYATQVLKLPEGEDEASEPAWKVMLVNHAPPDQPRLGYVARIEGRRLIATLGGYENQHPPLNRSGYEAFAARLASPEFLRVVERCTPDGPIVAHRATANRLRRFERQAALPEGLVSVGDAVCALCPVYGQGMTVAAIGAEVLSEALDSARQADTLDGLPRRFHRQLATAVVPAWASATQQDVLFRESRAWTVGAAAPSAEEETQQQQRGLPAPVRWYLANLRKLMSEGDGSNLTLFMEVGHMLSPPTVFFRPDVVAKVVLAALRRKIDSRR